jgi:hypothetical protein
MAAWSTEGNMKIAWHDRFEEAASVDELVRVVREYVGALESETRLRIPNACRLERIVRDDDIDDATYRLAGLARERRDDARLAEVFDLFLHASLRVSHMRRTLAQQVMAGVPRRFARQMG